MKTITQHRQPDTANWIDCAPEHAEGFRARGEIVREVIDRNEAEGKVAALNALITKSQAVLAAHLPPDGISECKAINELLGILDGPEQRAAQA